MVSKKVVIIFDSRTGNVEHFCQKLSKELVNAELIKLTTANASDQINQACILVTYTDGYGKIPVKTLKFVNKNHQNIRGVLCSGNRNWGTNFAKAGQTLSQKLKVPLIRQFELRGTKKDVIETAQLINKNNLI